MSNKSRWTHEEELNLIKDISSGATLDSLATKHNRSISAMELRLKKIIYENASTGKSLDSISKLLNIPEDKVRQYFYSYKEFREKHTGLIDDIIPTIKSSSNHQSKFSGSKGSDNRSSGSKGSDNQSGGSKGSSSNKLDKIKSKLRKMEEENRIIKLIIENKELTHKLNKLIKDGKLDEGVKNLIKVLRKSDK